MSRAYTKEELIKAIQQFVKKNNRLPKTPDFRNKFGLHSLEAYRRMIGDYKTILKVAGFEENWSVNRWTRKELIDAVQKFYKKNGRVPRAYEFTPKEGYPSRGAYCREFGCFSKGVEAAGFKPTKPGDYRTGLQHNTWSKRRILLAIIQFQENNRIKISDRMIRSNGYDGLPSRDVIKKHFRTVRNARLEAEQLKSELDEKKKRLEENGPWYRFHGE